MKLIDRTAQTGPVNDDEMVLAARITLRVSRFPGLA